MFHWYDIVFCVIVAFIVWVYIRWRTVWEKKEKEKLVASLRKSIEEGRKKTEESKKEMMVLNINGDTFYWRKDFGWFFYMLSWNKLMLTTYERRKIDLEWVDRVNMQVSQEQYDLFYKRYVHFIHSTFYI